MNILYINTEDQGGGASRIAMDLMQHSEMRGARVAMAVAHKKTTLLNINVLPKYPAWNLWSNYWIRTSHRMQERACAGAGFARLLGLVTDKHYWTEHLRGYEDLQSAGTWSLLDHVHWEPDLVHAHNLHGGYFDLRYLPTLSQRLPVFLTLHDAWLLTGHCAHTLGCDRWSVGCGSCPDISLYPAIRRDATAANWSRKRSIYAMSKLYIATPSEWLMDRVRRSILASAALETRVIPNGVDLSIFTPGDKRTARSRLGLPLDRWIVLFVGYGGHTNPWKDYRIMREAVTLSSAEDEDTLFISLGQAAPTEHIGSATIRFVPYQSDLNAVADYYRSADVYLHAALADTFPSVILEALACGTPVIATATGGIPEQIDDGETGFLVPPRDSSALHTRLRQLREDSALHQSLGRRAVAKARERFDSHRMLDTYYDWYRSILAQRTCHAPQH